MACSALRQVKCIPTSLANADVLGILWSLRTPMHSRNHSLVRQCEAREVGSRRYVAPLPSISTPMHMEQR